jgi:hypothetical protein
MNKIISCLLCFMLFGCSEINRSSYAPSEKVKIADEIRKKAATELMVQTGLQPCGTGGQMMDQVKMLALSFDYKQPLQIDEARELLIKSVDVLVAAVNADDRIRPYLNNYPFEPKNVQIRIFLRGRDCVDIPAGELSVISAIDGTFNYKIDNPKTKLFMTILNETYQEARQKTKKFETMDNIPVPPERHPKGLN